MPPHCLLPPAEGVPGCRTEFLAYRILYQAVHAKHGEILQLLNTLKRVTPEVSGRAGLGRCRAGSAAGDCDVAYTILYS